MSMPCFKKTRYSSIPKYPSHPPFFFLHRAKLLGHVPTPKLNIWGGGRYGRETMKAIKPQTPHNPSSVTAVLPWQREEVHLPDPYLGDSVVTICPRCRMMCNSSKDDQHLTSSQSCPNSSCWPINHPCRHVICLSLLKCLET